MIRKNHAPDPTDTRFALCGTFGGSRITVEPRLVTCATCRRLLNLDPQPPQLSKAGLTWLREYFRDTYSESWSSDYQLGLVGVVPADVLAWADVEQCEVAS